MTLYDLTVSLFCCLADIKDIVYSHFYMCYWNLQGFGQILLSELKMTQVWASNFWSRVECVWEVHCYPGSIIPGVCLAALLFPQHTASECGRLPSLYLSAWKLSCKTGATGQWEGAQIHTFLLRLYIPAHSSNWRTASFPKPLLHVLSYTNTNKQTRTHTHTHHFIMHCTSVSQIQQRKVIMTRKPLWQWGGG